MLVVPASVVSQCQLTPKSIVASILVSCPRHGKRRLVLCNADGSLQTTDTLNDVELVSAEHLFLQFIHLPSSAIAHSEACYTLLARTSVGAVALGTSNCHSSEFQWQNVYQDDELIWIETSATGFYGIHKDRSTISFDFISSVRDTTLYLPLKRTRAAPPITTTMNGSITQSLATYFSLPSEDGLWMGHDDGTVTFRCFQDGRQRDALVTLIPVGGPSILHASASRDP
ncbi:hypothetical protein BCR43DRAFT_487949 [Syncephalastrum racemosum]|uniref:Uncharacterized protein n=1 Tax=Syncephalastrum racemosum TaxID=13706 RepID=A0A1X2HJA3_SYNRA|nr:hypothetical protein BCR43DRAFT_487949 [Syncephalastrum racemosum]